MERLRLPTSVLGEVDVARLLRELNGLNDFFVGVQARTAGTAMQMPKLSRQLDQLARTNTTNLLDSGDRNKLLSGMQRLQKDSPKVQISFAAEPSPKALEQIVVWLRQNIHPHTLVQVGLQPSIAAGCILRTTSKVFDMSLRSSLKKQEPYLVGLITGAVNER